MYTYIIESQGAYKIGKAKDVDNRLAAYKTHNPAFELIVKIKGDHEKYLHEYFKSKRSHLEWYNLSKSDIDSIERVIQNKNKPEEVIVKFLECEEIENYLINTNTSLIATEEEFQQLLLVIEEELRKVTTIVKKEENTYTVI